MPEKKQKNDLFHNIRSLDRRYIAFMRMHICLTAITEIITIFVSTFIMKGGATATVPMIYNIIKFGAQPFFMIFAVMAARRLSPRVSQRIGFLAYMACFVFILILGEKAATGYYWLIALLLSLGAGFYFVTYSFQIQEYTTDENRDAATGISMTISYIIALVFPLLSGIFLGQFGEGDFTGYRVLFAVLLGIAALALFASLFLTPLRESYHPDDRKSHLREVFRAMVRGKVERMVLTMTFFKGIRSASLAFFVDILLFQLTGNETYNGINTTLGKAVAIASGLLYTVLVTNKRRKWSIFIGSGAVIATALILFIDMNPITLIIFSTVNTGLAIFITEPSLNLYFCTVGTMPELKGKAGEAHTVNEMFLAVGEVLGILLMILMTRLFPGSPVASTVTIILLAASQFICGILVDKIQKLMAEEGITEAAE